MRWWPALVVLAGCPYVQPGASDRFYDRDDDGISWPDDCDDADATVGGPVDVYEDADDDGFGDPTTATLVCDPPAEAMTDGSDCDDTDPDVNPGVPGSCDADTDVP
jgi:hypothetical protein